MNNLAVVILAAGKGKRMNNPDLPKVLAQINENPLIYYVISEVSNLNPNIIVVVIGHFGELVQQYVSNRFNGNLEFVTQEQQLGTGHAVKVTDVILSRFEGNTLILAGDVPNITNQTLNKFVELHISNKSDVSVLSAFTENPHGYGRIVRDEKNNFIKITEQKDASEEILKINEINSGIILANNKLLFQLLHLIKNNNKQGEFYLTDIIELARTENKNVFAFECADFDEIQGVNTYDELLKAENYKNSKGEN